MYSLRQGRAFLKEEEKITDQTYMNNASNVYLAQKDGQNVRNGKSGYKSIFNQLNPMQYFKKMVEPFDNGNDATTSAPTPVSASSSSASAPESVASSATGMGDIQKLNDAFDSKMNAYSSAISEYNKEILKGNNYFVVQVKTLTPINSCFNCDASLGGTDCSAMGVSNSNGEIRTALTNSTSPTANLLPCVQAGVTVPGWSANPNDSGSCVAPLGQKCCNAYMLNGQPVCQAGFGDDNYDEGAMNEWINACITPPSPDEINQRIALANEYCQGNGIDLNYWSKNANNFVLVTTQDPGDSTKKFVDQNDSCSGWANSGECEKNPNYMLSMCSASCNKVGANVPGANIRPFAKMNSVPVWIVNTFTNKQDANKAKATTVFSPTVQSTLKSTRDDMMNAGAALIKALSSHQSTSDTERKQIEQQMREIETKMSKLASQSSELDISLTDAEKVVASKNRMIAKPKHVIQHSTQDTSSNAKESFIGTSLLAQETDTRIQFQSNYTFYIVWFVIAAVLIVIMFSNFFYTSPPSSESELGISGESGSSSSNVLGFGIIAMLVFIYFIIQFALSRFNISRPQLPFESINPLFVFKSNS
jgi:hypothetical protein